MSLFLKGVHCGNQKKRICCHKHFFWRVEYQFSGTDPILYWHVMIRKIAFLLWWSRNCKFSDEKVQDQLWTNQQLENKCRNTLRKKKEEGHNACASSWVGISISFTLHQGIWTFSIWKLNSARNLKGGFHSSARVCIIYSHVHAF